LLGEGNEADCECCEEKSGVETVRMDAVATVESLPRDLKLRGAGQFGVYGGNLQLEDGDKNVLESEAEEGGSDGLVSTNEPENDIKR
jgi:hypothetical protein